MDEDAISVPASASAPASASRAPPVSSARSNAAPSSPYASSMSSAAMVRNCPAPGSLPATCTPALNASALSCDVSGTSSTRASGASIVRLPAAIDTPPPKLMKPSRWATVADSAPMVVRVSPAPLSATDALLRSCRRSAIRSYAALEADACMSPRTNVAASGMRTTPSASEYCAAAVLASRSPPAINCTPPLSATSVSPASTVALALRRTKPSRPSRSATVTSTPSAMRRPPPA